MAQKYRLARSNARHSRRSQTDRHKVRAPGTGLRLHSSLPDATMGARTNNCLSTADDRRFFALAKRCEECAKSERLSCGTSRSGQHRGMAMRGTTGGRRRFPGRNRRASPAVSQLSTTLLAGRNGPLRAATCLALLGGRIISPAGAEGVQPCRRLDNLLAKPLDR